MSHNSWFLWVACILHNWKACGIARKVRDFRNLRILTQRWRRHAMQKDHQNKDLTTTQSELGWKLLALLEHGSRLDPRWICSEPSPQESDGFLWPRLKSLVLTHDPVRARWWMRHWVRYLRWWNSCGACRTLYPARLNLSTQIKKTIEKQSPPHCTRRQTYTTHTSQSLAAIDAVLKCSAEFPLHCIKVKKLKARNGFFFGCLCFTPCDVEEGIQYSPSVSHFEADRQMSCLKWNKKKQIAWKHPSMWHRKQPEVCLQNCHNQWLAFLSPWCTQILSAVFLEIFFGLIGLVPEENTCECFLSPLAQNTRGTRFTIRSRRERERRLSVYLREERRSLVQRQK